MGRISSGWKLRQRAPGHAYAVRFWLSGREIERSTGTSDPVEAGREASRIYADEVRRAPKPKRRRAGSLDLEELVAAWIVDLAATHDPKTCKIWELYATTHWLPHFSAMHHVTDAMCSEYMRKRLLLVQKQTVTKELSALRQFTLWLLEVGAIPEEINVPSVPRRSLGTAHPVARRSAAIELSPEECERIIAALPEWSNSRRVDLFAIRPRFIVAYETSLRPSTLDALVAPDHYRRGSGSIRLTPGIDKNRMGREVPLSARARSALDVVLDMLPPADGAKAYAGLIFGKHEYRDHLESAARSVLSPDRAQKFCGAHLRSARITHALERTGNLPGVQYLAGHKRASTTALYVRASYRAAEDVLREESEPKADAKSKRSSR
jgi:site-specific recombinase XerC